MSLTEQRKRVRLTPKAEAARLVIEKSKPFSSQKGQRAILTLTITTGIAKNQTAAGATSQVNALRLQGLPIQRKMEIIEATTKIAETYACLIK